MKMKEKVLTGLASAALFGTLAVGGTVALFSTEAKVTGHLVTGNYQASLYLTDLTQDEITSEGKLASVEEDLTKYDGYEAGSGVNLSVYTGEIFSAERIVPTMTGEATFRLINRGDVAFTYRVEMSELRYYAYDSANGAYAEKADAALKDQIKFTGLTEDAPVTGEIAPGKDASFKVAYEFLDMPTNNDAMNQKATFDVRVTTVQVTKA